MTDLPDAPPSNVLVAGKYQLVRLIGRGGMGTVWEGRHSSLGTRVAIKFIDSEYADSQEARARFDNEARAAATIQSKHAIQIFDHGVTDDGKPYIVMEMLQGEPLDGRLDRVGRLSLADTARILRQVGRALSRAHERGIVHRDLKPENIFLVRTPDDDDEIAKVLDFGIAKFKKVDGQSGGLTSSTKTGAVLGTPFYMAPEQARGLRDLDYRVDLWSMGVIAFRCICGVLPFEGVSVGDLLVKICTTPAPIPSTVVASLPPAFDAWFLRALDKDPARRFQSALELTDSLASAAGLSVKRAPSMSPTSDPLSVPATSNHPSDHRSRSGSATSSPFTASSPRASTTRWGTWVAAGAASLVGIGIVTLGARLYLHAKADPPQTFVQGAVSSPSVDPAHAVVAPPAVSTAPVAVTVDAGTTSASDHSDKGHHAAGHGAASAKPGAVTPPPASSAPIPAWFPGSPKTAPTTQPIAASPPPAVAPPPPVPTQAPAPPKAKPVSNSVDLGY
jgi:serine/threonine-protein kinase